jgi:hypothetical protein
MDADLSLERHKWRPQVKITKSHKELVAAVNSVQQAWRVRELPKISSETISYFTDSSDILGILKTDSGFAVKGAKMLAASVLTEEDVLGRGCKFITLRVTRFHKYSTVYDTAALLILNNTHPLAKLSLRRAYEVGH